jgi:hypothetical protein
MTTETYLKLRPFSEDGASVDESADSEDVAPESFSWRTALALTAILATAFVIRTWNLMALGFNSDEAVYAGQASSIAGNTELLQYFPIFRAHPLLFQTLISIPYQIAVSPLVGRLMSVAFGIGTVYLVYLVGKTLYTRRIGMIAALIIALMPYHVVVTRQILLDGPLAFFATLSLLLLAHYGRTRNLLWFYAAFAAMGLTVLAKETGIIMFGAIYIFIALLGTVRLRHMVLASLLWFIVVLPYPVSVAMSGRTSTGGQFLAWQLFRRANHPWYFYFAEVPPAMGVLVLAFAVGALIYMRKRWTWTETLLNSWIVIPVVFFVLFPVKGFQFLLPVAMPVAVLAAVGIVGLRNIDRTIRGFRVRGPVLMRLGVLLVASSLLLATIARIDPQSQSTEFLAGSGGVPGGREAGLWIGENTPKGSQILTLGPSMANIIQFYGDRKAFGLSVSPNPLHRNPVYEPINNPDLWIRSNDLQYIIWDSYSASRSSFFSDRLLNYAERYNGRIVHTEFVTVSTDAGESLDKPVIIIYEVRP